MTNSWLIFFKNYLVAKNGIKKTEKAKLSFQAKYENCKHRNDKKIGLLN